MPLAEVRRDGAARHALSCFVAFVLAAAAVTACRDGSPTSPSSVAPPLTERLETRDVVFHFAPGDSVDAEWQQAFHERATALLGVSPAQKLHYHKYLSEAHLRQLTGAQSRAWADPPGHSVHSPDRHDGHEALHVYTYSIGWPPDYFLEGIAVGLNLDPFTGAGPFYPYPVGTHVHHQSRNSLVRGELIPIESIVESTAFWNRPRSLTYPQAGSFIRFLADEHGIGRLRQATASLDHSASREAVVSRFQAVYGFPLGEAERSWHDFLRTWAPSPEGGTIDSPPRNPVRLLVRTWTGGYVLFAPILSYATYLIDGAGRVVHTWESDLPPGVSTYLLDNGHLLRCAQQPGAGSRHGGHGGRIQEFRLGRRASLGLGGRLGRDAAAPRHRAAAERERLADRVGAQDARAGDPRGAGSAPRRLARALAGPHSRSQA